MNCAPIPARCAQIRAGSTGLRGARVNFRTFSASPILCGIQNRIGIRASRSCVTAMRILIVEDHDDTRDALERFLSRCGYGVAVAADLRTALNLVQAQPFDAIVTDIALPDGTGYALISEVRRRGIRIMTIA